MNLGHISPIPKVANIELRQISPVKFGLINTRTLCSCNGFQLGCIEGHTFKPRFFETGEIRPSVYHR